MIADSKFGKSRLVFLHPTAVAALRAYERARDRGVPRAGGGHVPRQQPRQAAGRPQHSRTTFAALVAAAGIKAPPGQRAPRLHDLRHVFTVATLLDWYRDGGDVQARLPLLSTWLGHVDPKSTYWYLQAVPELLALAAGRLEPGGRAGGPVTDLAPILQGFFTDRLARQKKASPHTVAAYRDTCRLLLAFAQEQTGKRAQQAQPRRPRRRADRRVPGPPGRPSGATAAPPATPGWPRSTRCSATRPRGHPSTPP